MEILVGRITADAKVTTLKDERKVVNFSIAIKYSYKVKGSEAVTKVVTYVNCAYWRSDAIAPFLITKGSIVEVCGRIGARAYNNMQGEAKASLDFYATEIRLFGNPEAQEAVKAPKPAQQTIAGDDLPF
jgi:single-strand DNA-binding protein